MTRGGPLNSTISASMYTYQQFGFGNYGVASAMAYLTFLVILVVTVLQFRVTRERPDNVKRPAPGRPTGV